MGETNIEVLVVQALTLCREQRFTETFIDSKGKVFRPTLLLHKESGYGDYNDGLLQKYIGQQETSYIGQLARYPYRPNIWLIYNRASRICFA